LRPIALALISATLIAALFSVAACVPRPPPPTVQTTVVQTPTGAEVVETIQLTATVAGINYDTRQVVLLGPGGRRISYRVDESVVNFNQIKVRDMVRVTITQKLAVNLRKETQPESVGVAATVVLAPKGAAPGGVVAATSEVTATVTSVDAQSRKVTLQFVDGTSETVQVGKSIDFSKVNPGDSVTARLTESIAIAVERT